MTQQPGSGAQALLSSIPCQPMSEYAGLFEDLVRWSVSWYLIWGVLPAFITALIYASENQPARG